MINRLIQLYNSYYYNNIIIEEIKELMNKNTLTKDDILSVEKLLNLIKVN